jgi:hypothetical protein
MSYCYCYCVYYCLLSTVYYSLLYFDRPSGLYFLGLKVQEWASHAARYLAPASFLYDFAAQQYGMLFSPNMKDVHDANLAAFSPQP